jgi:hypothetical protein
MQEQDAVNRVDCAFGELLVNPVQRIARLKGNHILAACFRQEVSRLLRSAAEVLKVIVARHLQHPDRAGRVQSSPTRHFMDEGMFGVMGP